MNLNEKHIDRNAFLQKVKNAILSVDDSAEVILFGSRARGDSKADSDWDILVLTNESNWVPLSRRITDRVYDIELEYEQPVSTVVVDRPRWNKLAITGFYENVKRDGIEL